MRPQLKSGLALVWRDEQTLQIGLDPERALVLAGVDARAVAVLESLDGTRDVGGVLSRAESAGWSEPEVRRLLALLADGEVLEDGAARQSLRELDATQRATLGAELGALALQDTRGDGGAEALARRRSAVVEIRGAGRVGATAAGLLAASGVGTVAVRDQQPAGPGDLAPGGLAAEHLGRERGGAAAEVAAAAAPWSRTTSGPAPSCPDAVLLAPASAPDPAEVAELVRDGVPHLLAVVRELTGVVGPLVLPGRSACLRCQDLHRSDRDPGWARVAAQLCAGTPSSGRRSGLRPGAAVLCASVAAQAAQQLLTLLDGATAPLAVDGTLEISARDGAVRRRSWLPHPACGCQWGSA